MYNNIMNTTGKTKELDDLVFKQDNRGYYGLTISLHRYIYIKHYGKIPDKMYVHHINGNKEDNRIKNLTLITSVEHNKLHHIGKQWNLGKHHTNETKEKMSKIKKEYWKNHISSEVLKPTFTFTGRKHSENSKNKMRISNKRANLGKKMPEETKEKMRIARKKYLEKLSTTKNLLNPTNTGY